MIIGPNHDAPPSPLRPLFRLGQLFITPAAKALLEGQDMPPGALVRRHEHGDWGDVHPDDRGLNDAALHSSERIFSVYVIPVIEQRVWVITEWDRSYTTILLPDDY